MKRILYIVALSSFLFSCEKAEKTGEEWSRLLDEKRQEIDNLIVSTVCNDVSEWSVFSDRLPYACSETHFPIHASIKDEFDRLWADYLYLSEKNIDIMIKEGVIIEPCWDDIWVHQAPLHIACDNNKPSLVYVNDLDAEKSKEQLAMIYPRIEAYLAELTCENSEDWTYTVLYNNGCSPAYIPVRRTNERSAIRTDIELYNAHRANVLQKEQVDCSNRITTYPDGVYCENGKPVVKTKTY